MSKPYTPTTEQVRDEYAKGGGEYRDIAEGWFDRWLAQVKAEARREGQAEAWDDGATNAGRKRDHRVSGVQP